MTDIIDRLEAVAAMDLRTGPILAHTLDTAKEAAAEINRLRAALAPFARVATNFQWVRDKRLDQERIFVWVEGRNQNALAITVGDVFRAVEALEQLSDKSEDDHGR